MQLLRKFFLQGKHGFLFSEYRKGGAYYDMQGKKIYNFGDYAILA
jgi:hypothetical protein